MPPRIQKQWPVETLCIACYFWSVHRIGPFLIAPPIFCRSFIKVAAGKGVEPASLFLGPSEIHGLSCSATAQLTQLVAALKECSPSVCILRIYLFFFGLWLLDCMHECVFFSEAFFFSLSLDRKKIMWFFVLFLFHKMHISIPFLIVIKLHFYSLDI